MSTNTGTLIHDLYDLAAKVDQAERNLAEKLFSELTYASYAHQRRISPEVSPERWAKIFPRAQAMEARYQEELSRCQATIVRGSWDADGLPCLKKVAEGTNYCPEHTED